MSFAQRLQSYSRFAIMGMLIGFISYMAANAAAQSRKPLPVVISADVPFYPSISRSAHIEGDVHLRVSTDGKRVSAISVESGPSMLVSAAEDNVRTWQFKEPHPTMFETTFHYKLIPSTCDAKCNCDFEFDSGTVFLRLPTDVEVTAKTVETCDPAVEIKHRRPK